jgi:hypothetical protein
MKAVLMIGAAMFLAACSGSGDSGGGVTPSAQGTTVSGTVTAPNGQLAKVKLGPLQWFVSLFVGESHAQGVPGLLPVGGARIFVFQADNNGNPTSGSGNSPSILAQGTTQGDGSFSVQLPAGTSLASNLMVQATSGSVPSRVCDPSMTGCPAGQTSLNSPAVSTTLNINPASELATRQVFLRIAQAGASGTLNNYTTAEVAALIRLVQAAVADNATVVGLNATDTINNIATLVQPLANDVLNGIDSPGQADPGVVSGIYSVMAMETNVSWLTGANHRAGDLERVVLNSTVVLNADGTFTIAGEFRGAKLKESCSATCSRSFTRSPINETNFDRGTYIRTTNQMIFFTSQDGTFTRMFLNPSATIGVIPFPDEMGFAVAVKQGSGISNADLGAFNVVKYGSHLTGGTSSQDILIEDAGRQLVTGENGLVF